MMDQQVFLHVSILSLIKTIFEASMFIPHGHCFLWKPALVWLHVLSDSVTALAYYSIPITLFRFVQKRADLPFNWVFILFAAFITACGTSHLLSVWTLWHPIYWFSGGIKAITALVSLGTAIALFPLMPKALAIPSPAALEAANRALTQEIIERQRVEAEQQQAEHLLKASEARYRAIVEAQTELIARFLPDNTMVFANGAYYRYFGLQPEDVIGKSYVPVVFEDDRAVVARRIQGMSADHPTLTVENRVVVEGEVRWTQWANCMVFDEQGQFVEFQAVGRDITNLKQAEAQLQASLREKEVLLKEIHHRVKNNLQIVYSLLRLQRRALKDQQVASSLLESQNRIESIALIHEKLYQSKDLARINLAEYIPSLATNLFSTYTISRNQIALKTDIEPVFLTIDRAIPCGLIMNELLSNSLKYAFPHLDQGNLEIHIKLYVDVESSKITLVIADNGVGISNNVICSQPETLGLQLVQGFVDQLKGTLQMNCQNGTTFQITFPGDPL